MKRIILVTIGLVLIAAVVLGTRAVVAQLGTPGAEIPVAAIQRGDVDTSVVARAELRAARSEVLSAPPSGTQLRILKLVPTGTPVRKGDVVVEFDPSDQEFIVEEQKSILEEAYLEIEKLLAEQAAQKAQDDVDLLTAQFDLRKAELDVKGNELLSAIEARKNELTLEEARRRLAQLQEDVASRTKSNAAALAVAMEKKNKAQIAIEQAQRLLDQMQLRATMDGIVAVKDNRETNFFFWGMTFNEYREGDTVSSGRPVAEVLDLSQIELAAKVPESERARIAAGQQAQVALDAFAMPLSAKATMVGGIAPARFWGPTQGPTREFEVVFALDEVPEVLRPGLTGEITIAGEPLKNVLYVPRQALFERDGKPVVFVKDGSGFKAQEVKVVARTPSRVVIERVVEGTQVALADPTKVPGGAGGGPAAAPASMLGTR